MLFIVVPAYNEEKNIGRVLSDLFSHGYKNIIVVDDGSDDRTADIASEAGAIVLKHEVNRGQGAALETGNEYARKNNADFVVHFDADGQFNPADILPAVEFLRKNNLDVALGSRFLDARTKMPCTKRRILLPISRIINRFFSGIKLTDAHNGFRVLGRRALDKIRIRQDRMAHNTQILKDIKQSGLSFAEFPVEVRYSSYGQGVEDGFEILGDLIKEKIIR